VLIDRGTFAPKITKDVNLNWEKKLLAACAKHSPRTVGHPVTVQPSASTAPPSFVGSGRYVGRYSDVVVDVLV
jgi:hypothetical protein